MESWPFQSAPSGNYRPNKYIRLAGWYILDCVHMKKPTYSFSYFLFYCIITAELFEIV
jgi:hypothetical protein